MVSRKKELVNGRVANETMKGRKEARKAPKAANLIGTVTMTKFPVETKAKAKVKVRAKLDIATIAMSKDTSE